MGLVIALLFQVSGADAQEMQEHGMPGMKMSMPSMNVGGMVLLTDSMNQEGSGTSWIPASTPMRAFHMMLGKSWPAMVHGALTVRYTRQGSGDSPRSGDAFSAPNWIMAMTQHKLGDDDQVAFRVMMSLDRVTEGGDGYPLLFQTGESWEGKPLIDRQHPHDLFGEASASYSHRFNERWSAYAYLGYPGEPAIGPPVYLHRITSPEGGDAPIGHHWQDATHITFGVLTAGLAWHGMAKVEGSVFTGREPDENRWDFDRPKFDSYSGRITLSPHRNLSMQFSAGSVKSPESLHPDEDVQKMTASILYHLPIGQVNENWWSNALVWGANTEHDLGTQHSLLFESSLAARPFTFFTRLELVEKLRGDLGLSADSARAVTIGAYSAGTAYTFGSLAGIDCSLGVQGTLYSKPAELASFYGDHPFSFEVFLRLQPAVMMMD